MNPSQHFGIGLHAPLFHATFELVLEVTLVKHENQRTLIDHAIAIPCHIFLLHTGASKIQQPPYFGDEK